MQTKPPFHGIIPPLLTPLSDRDTLDLASLSRLIEHVLAGGVSGVFILGTTGEGPSLSYRVRRELITQTCEMVAGRVPVLVGITDSSFAESLDLSLVAADAGAPAVVLAPPYYLPASQEELVGYVKRLAGELPLPLVLYNMPSLTKVSYEFETLRQLTELESIVGLKDSGGDIDYFAKAIELKQLRPDWSLLVGPEHLLLRSMELGGDGGVSGGSNICPEIYVACYDAMVVGDNERAATYQQKIDALQEIYTVGHTDAKYIQGTKTAAAVLGLCDDRMSEPFVGLGPQGAEKVRAILNKLAASASERYQPGA